MKKQLFFHLTLIMLVLVSAQAQSGWKVVGQLKTRDAKDYQ